ncbi:MULTISPECIES: GDP-L-fucose synthase family protein [Helicobacter]|uniref:GDP-L-fucose synthase family protein n=1 Tax=Helicobacter TaxID=209 RepID=UPI002635AE55|nr:GDP-L-fucose synthase [Helicobacter sp. UBA3407]
MKILITGGSGMVGRNLLEKSREFSYEILAPTRAEMDLLSPLSIHSFLQKNLPDCIVHCAGLVGGIAANIAKPVEFLSINAYIGLNLINECAKIGIKRFLNLASSCMYPRNAPNPLKEEYILTGELEPTNEGYALAKILATRMCEYITRTQNDYLYKTAIPCNLYGKYDKFEPTRAHLIPAVIAKIHQAKEQNLPQVEIWGDGSARREFMYAEDLADFVFYALEKFEKMPQNLNVGLGYDYNINEYYQTIAKIIGYEGEFCHNIQKPSGMQQKLIDNTRLKAFGWNPKTTLESGIQKTYEYFLTQQGKE